MFVDWAPIPRKLIFSYQYVNANAWLLTVVDPGLSSEKTKVLGVTFQDERGTPHPSFV